MTIHPKCTFPDCLPGDCGKPDATCQAGLQAIQDAAQKLVEDARALGLVLTIEQIPLQPLAMGNYRTVVSVRGARKQAEPRLAAFHAIPLYVGRRSKLSGTITAREIAEATGLPLYKDAQGNEYIDSRDAPSEGVEYRGFRLGGDAGVPVAHPTQPEQPR